MTSGHEPKPSTGLTRKRLLLAVVPLTLGIGALLGMKAQQPDPGDRLPPGVDQAHSSSLAADLAKALTAKGASYQPRTEHLRDDGSPQFLNRLILEDSPYLLQHAHNPVNWYAWGDEAFEAAKREDKPIFLSIGYSTCHWCHVMERESFENLNIGEFLNQNFISIKVDRERRPDVDHLYMTALQVAGRRGGWPMSSFLTSDGKPFFGATYFPPDNFLNLLAQVKAAWTDQRDQLLADAEKLTIAVRTVTSAGDATVELAETTIDEAIQSLLGNHDTELGGFGQAPKFPNEPDLLLMLQRLARTQDMPNRAELEHALLLTLDSMAQGGIYDQIAGGFHRYSTDAGWQVPHFEKMLYNQSQLARVYTWGWLTLNQDRFRRTAEETLDYVVREMTSTTGAFYSATDADSVDPERENELHEGAFFLWTPTEIDALLTPEDAALVKQLYQVTDAGNFEGKTILHLAKTLESSAKEQGTSVGDLYARLQPIKKTLREARARRPPPLRDDKIVTSWNAMMITAFCEASQAFGNEQYLDAAKRAAEDLWRINVSDHKEGGEGGGKGGSEGLPHVFRASLEGRGSVDGVHEDHSHLLEALLALYDLTGESLWLERATDISARMKELFWDEEQGGYFTSIGGDNSLLLARPKSTHDGATPAGNSVAVRSLARLAVRTGDVSHRHLAMRTVAALSSSIARGPSGFSYLLLGLDDIQSGELGPERYLAGGAGVLRARTSGSGETLRAIVEVEVAEGWHINSNQPIQDTLLPSRLLAHEDSGWDLSNVEYPPAVDLESTVQEGLVKAFVGKTAITAKVTKRASDDATRQASPGLVLVMEVQACDDTVCLEPEELVLTLKEPQENTP